MDIFRSQPWLVQQDIEEQKRREVYDAKLAKLKQMAAIVENKREDLARDAARLERLEKRMEGAVRGVRRCRHVAATPSTRPRARVTERTRRRRRHDESSPLAPLADNEKLRDSEDADVTEEQIPRSPL